MAPDPEHERLEELEQQIDEVRREAVGHGTIPPSDPPRTFADPDADGEVEGSSAPAP